jgi:hypothetical protein
MIVALWVLVVALTLVTVWAFFAWVRNRGARIAESFFEGDGEDRSGTPRRP